MNGVDQTGSARAPGVPGDGPLQEPSIDLTRSGPPAEVLEQMARADAINARLRASGMQLAFSLSGDGCALQIELRDTAGNLLRMLTADEALAIEAEGQ